MEEEPNPEDSEARSVFVSQLAARLTARDLGYFFEDKLGENTVLDARIVTDRLSRRSKGYATLRDSFAVAYFDHTHSIGYVEFRTIDLVEKAINLSGTVVMGLPIKVQLTEAERNKTHAGDGQVDLFFSGCLLTMFVGPSTCRQVFVLVMVPCSEFKPPMAWRTCSDRGARLYVGSLHFNLTESDIKQVFEPFGELEFVDLHKDPVTGRSKGYAFVQYKRVEDARMALEQMDGFDLAGRTVSVLSASACTVFIQRNSFVSTRCMRRDRSDMPSRTLWMRLEVCI
jgi:RNA-binding protein 39